MGRVFTADPTAFEEQIRELFRDRHKRADTERRPGGDRHKNASLNRHLNRNSRNRPFIGIDGEGGGEDELGRRNYLLLRASDKDGDYTQTLFKDNQPLTANDCFEFILSLPANAYIIGFYFNYDATQMLRQLPEDRLHRMLHGTGAQSSSDAPERAAGVKIWTNWKAKYELKYLPRQYLQIARSKPTANGMSTTEADKSTIRTVHEVGGFFQSPFVTAINAWQVGSKEERDFVQQNKLLRPQFDKMSPQEIRYCQTECRLLAE